jgi:uncharacterized protein YjiS (DUF1127 family)
VRNNLLATPMGRTVAWWLLRVDHGRGRTRAAISTVALWIERSRSRRALAALDDHQLRDIGVSQGEARIESAKPFWMPWARRERRTIRAFARVPWTAGVQSGAARSSKMQ